MKKLNLLKTILDFFWFFALFFLGGLILFLPFYLFDSEMDIAVKIKGQEISSQTIFSKAIVVVNIVSSLLFLYSIYLLRKVVVLFQKRDIFNGEVVLHFNLIGNLIVISSIISSFSIFLYNTMERNHLGLSLDFGSYDSFLISVSLGLFFMVISEVFKVAKTIGRRKRLDSLIVNIKRLKYNFMKNYKKLILVLYILSRFFFRIIFLFILIVVGAEFFTTDGKIEEGYLSIHHSKGYPFPAYVHPEINSVTYSETEKNQKIPITFKKLTLQGYQISANSSITSQYKTIDYVPSNEIKFEKLDLDHFPHIETNFYIKTSSLLINFILGFRIYLLLFYFLIISFYSTKILKTLKNDLIFQPEISKYLNIIGVIIILMEFFKIISYQFFDKKLIDLMKLRNDKIFDGYTLENIYDLSLMPFIIGLLFLLLALILNAGIFFNKKTN